MNERIKESKICISKLTTLELRTKKGNKKYGLTNHTPSFYPPRLPPTYLLLKNRNEQSHLPLPSDTPHALSGSDSCNQIESLEMAKLRSRKGAVGIWVRVGYLLAINT